MANRHFTIFAMKKRRKIPMANRHFAQFAMIKVLMLVVSVQYIRRSTTNHNMYEIRTLQALDIVVT